MIKYFTTSFFFLLFINGFSQNWNEIIKITSSDRDSTDRLGYSVSVSGDYALISSHYDDEDETNSNPITDAGSAYIFERDNLGNWIQQQKIVASDRGAGDLFGRSLSISGDYAIIGTYAEDEDLNGGNTMNDAGSAYIFERDGQGVWNEVQKIVASDRGNNDFFGNAVDISGNYAIVGAHYENHDATGGNGMSNSGSAYIYERDGQGVWSEVEKIVSSDRAINDLFGRSVSIYGDYALVGAYKEDEDISNSNTVNSAGSAYIFKKDGLGNWNEVQKIVASDREKDDRFGYSVDITANNLIVGAYWEDNNLSGGDSMNIAGSAYIFEMDSMGTWSETKKLIASDREIEGVFGVSVSISNDRLIVGATGEGKDSDGNNFLKSAGASYIFEKQSNDWVEVQKIAPSVRDSFDLFSRSVSIDNETILIGAHLEDDDSNNLNYLKSAGSAYIFEIVEPIDGVENYDNLSGIKISPNPSNGIFNLELSENDNYNINVKSIDGKSIQKFSTNSSKIIQFKLNTSGIYFVNITSKNGSKTIKLIVY